MSEQGELFAVFTVHCFACPHTVKGTDPAENHDRMEVHYRAEHAGIMASLGY